MTPEILALVLIVSNFTIQMFKIYCESKKTNITITIHGNENNINISR